MSVANLDLDVFKDIPGYKGILKAVLKYQIQLLVEQLSEHGGEESVLLLANISEGTLSHLGTKAGKGFLIDNNDVKRQYLTYCLKRHQNEKRKSEFMSAGGSQEGLQPVKIVRAAPESVARFPVHKKPYFRVQRRNTRIRSGSKQFASAFSRVGVNRSTGQRLGGREVPSGGYLVPRESVSGEAYEGNGGQGPDEALNSPYEDQGSNEQCQNQSPQVVVKTEIETDDSCVNEENTSTVNENEVTVKVEPPDEIDETGDRESRAIPEDIQTFGDGLGQQFSPMESEESFSEGNQSFGFLDDETFYKKYSQQRRAQKYTPDDVMKAIQAVRGGTNRFRAGKMYGIPRSTMFRLVDKYGRIKNTCFTFMTSDMTSNVTSSNQQTVNQLKSDEIHPIAFITNKHLLPKDNLYSRDGQREHVPLAVREFEDMPSTSNSQHTRLPTLSPEFSVISPEIKHFDQIPTVVRTSHINE